MSDDGLVDGPQRWVLMVEGRGHSGPSSGVTVTWQLITTQTIPAG